MDNTTRREVIQTLGLMAAGSVLSLDLPYALAESNKAIPGIKFGVQLNAFPVDPKRFQTFMNTLVQIKQIGWKGWVENEEEREDLSKTGLEVIAPA